MSHPWGDRWSRFGIPTASSVLSNFLNRSIVLQQLSHRSSTTVYSSFKQLILQCKSVLTEERNCQRKRMPIGRSQLPLRTQGPCQCIHAGIGAPFRVTSYCYELLVLVHSQAPHLISLALETCSRLSIFSTLTQTINLIE